MSALGFLAPPVSFEQVRAVVMPLGDVEPGGASRLRHELSDEAAELVRSAGVAARDCRVRREAALRFQGQSYSLPVPLAAGRITPARLGQLRAAFLDLYRERYHRLQPDVPLELVSWRVTVSGPRPEIHVAPPGWGGSRARKGSRPVFFPEAGGFVDCPVHDRFALAPGRRLRGPAIVEEPESTVVIGPGGSATVDGEGNLLATLPRAGAALGR